MTLKEKPNFSILVSPMANGPQNSAQMMKSPGAEHKRETAPAPVVQPTNSVEPIRTPIAWYEFGLALAAFLLTSAVNFWLQQWMGYQAIALVYLLAVVLLALFIGRGPVLFGAALTALGWNFFFVPPQF